MGPSGPDGSVSGGPWAAVSGRVPYGGRHGLHHLRSAHRPGAAGAPADAAALQTLPGIGPALAERIIAYRTEHGPFRTVEELLEVKGIGEATLEKLRQEVTVGEETDKTQEDTVP